MAVGAAELRQALELAPELQNLQLCFFWLLLGALGAAAAIALSSSNNPYDDGKDGWPEDGKVFNSTFDALMTG